MDGIYAWHQPDFTIDVSFLPGAFDAQIVCFQEALEFRKLRIDVAAFSEAVPSVLNLFCNAK